MNKSELEKQNESRETYKIKISTPDIGYEPFPVSIINRSTREAMTFDPSLGKPATISYKLTKAGSIRLRIVRRDNPELLLLTLQDWTSQEFGVHEIKWDGRDASGNLIDNKQVLILFEARETAFGGKHQLHDKSICRDPKVVIEADQELTRDVQGNLSVKVSLSGGMENLTNNADSEVRYFIDYALVKKEKFQNGEKDSHFTLDTEELANGQHTITVNIDDFHDHIGTASVMISVKN